MAQKHLAAPLEVELVVDALHGRVGREPTLELQTTDEPRLDDRRRRLRSRHPPHLSRPRGSERHDLTSLTFVEPRTAIGHHALFHAAVGTGWFVASFTARPTALLTLAHTSAVGPIRAAKGPGRRGNGEWSAPADRVTLPRTRHRRAQIDRGSRENRDRTRLTGSLCMRIFRPVVQVFKTCAVW